MAKVDVSALAKAVQDLPDMSRQRYGAIRRKLIKNGFSEIALFQAVTNHCDENCIKHSTMAREMLDLLIGCGDNVFFPKMDNNYTYLRGLYHDLRYGDLDRDEPKCAEQRGQFLCNRCYLIKPESERTAKKTDRHSCKECSSTASNAATKRYAEKMRKNPKQPEVSTPVTEPKPEPIFEPTEVVEVNPEPEVIHRLEGIRVKEVMADASGATVTIECSMDNLGEVLMAVQSL